MAKKKLNENCSLQGECERNCDFVGREHKCDYYFANQRPEDGRTLKQTLEYEFTDDDYTNELGQEFTYTEEVTGKIVNIPVELLHNHHQNPRKEYGDLTELSDSIKAKGILQNLTVVPFWFETTGVGCDYPKQQAEMGYLVVIGNRRLRAAKMAGLTHLPCIIADMTHAEQVQTMLLENMQRSDLTVYEQAQGFQMMLDFGDSVETISEKTGFSQSTVRRRLKMTELNQDTLKEVSDRQLSLGDFDRLSEIEDVKTRDNVLKHIGTNNFENELRKAIDNQKRTAAKSRWREAFERLGVTEIDYDEIYSGKYDYVSPGYIDLLADVSDLENKMEDGVQYFAAFSYGSIYIRKERAASYEADKEAEAAERERANAERNERNAAIDQAFKRAYILRHDFVMSLSEAVCKKHFANILWWAVYFDVEYSDIYWGDFAGLFGIPEPETEDEAEDEVYFGVLKPKVQEEPNKALLYFAYTCSDDREGLTCRDWNGEYNSNKLLSILYNFLESIGYEMSDEEKELVDGTSELYLHREGEEE